MTTYSDLPNKPTALSRVLTKLIQAGLWLSFPLLLLLYLFYSVDRQSGYLYNVIKETPIERTTLRALPYLWRHKSFLERQSMNAGLNPLERMTSKLILQRMERRRPTHGIQLQNGDFIFGRPLAHTPSKLTIARYDGNHRIKTVIKTDTIASMTALVMGHGDFSPKNIRFLIQNGQKNHFYLHPYLFASECPFKSVMELHAILSALEDSFRKQFGSLINQADDAVVQVSYFSTMASLTRQAVELETNSTLNASAFFDKTENTLFLCHDPAIETPYPSHMFQTFQLDAIRNDKSKQRKRFRIIRHEGAHHLANSLGMFKGFSSIPFWIEEGLAQHCEEAPFNQLHSEKIEFLRHALNSGTLLEWDTVLSLPLNDVDTLTDDEQQLLYAQSWLLFHYLMRKEHRPEFFSFLIELQSDGKWDAHHKVSLANALKITWEKLVSDLQKIIHIQSKQGVFTAKLLNL